MQPPFSLSWLITHKVSPIAYCLALPPSLSKLHYVFYLSQLKKYCRDPSHVLQNDSMQLKNDLTYFVRPTKIFDRSQKELKGKTIPLKVLWERLSLEQVIWEKEEDI